MLTQIQPETSLRKKEIVKNYLFQLDKHMDDLRTGKADHTFEIKDFADLLHIHPTHLSNTLNEVLDQSPCDVYERRLVALSKELMQNTSRTIADVAHQLFYDPSNFTKFFKRFEGITPKQYRQNNVKI